MIKLDTEDPKGLLQAIYDGIDKARGTKGSIDTWVYDENKHLRHSTESDNEWEKRGWLIPSFPVGFPRELRFTIGFPDLKGTLKLGAGNIKPQQLVYAVYHGRFLEMLMSHFSERFTITQVTEKLPPAKKTK